MVHKSFSFQSAKVRKKDVICYMQKEHLSGLSWAISGG